MSVSQRSEVPPKSSNGADKPAAPALYGNAFLLSDAPDHKLPAVGMASADAMRLIGEEIVLDGIPMRNLATFVTTWMEPEVQRVIAENLHRNYVDHAEYPQTAEIEQRCIGCWPTSGTRRARRSAPAPRGPPRRSCSARYR